MSQDRRQSRAAMAIAMAIAGMGDLGHGTGPLALDDARTATTEPPAPREPTEADLARLAKAEEKRQRKAAKRRRDAE